jgi:hypothetical protein
MTQPPVRKQPGIPIWVWLLVLIVVIAALWWILAADEPAPGATGEPLPAEPVLEEQAVGAPGATGVGYGTDDAFGTGMELGTAPIEEPPPPAP